MTANAIVTGAAGCGKFSLDEALARTEGLRLIEGDTFHDEANIDKMCSGIALTDVDREGRLARLGDELGRHRESGVRLTCSGLRRACRDRFCGTSTGLRFVFLGTDRDTALHRVPARAAEHSVSAEALDDDSATLQSPVGEPAVQRLYAVVPAEQLRHAASAWLHARAQIT